MLFPKWTTNDYWLYLGGCSHCFGTNVVIVHTLVYTCCGVNSNIENAPFAWWLGSKLTISFLMAFVTLYWSKDLVERMMRNSGLWPQALPFMENSFFFFFFRCHETTLIVNLPNWAWKPLVLSVRQVVFFLLYFNEHSIQLFMCLSPRSFTSRIWSQDLVVGWQIWNFFFF